MNHEGTKEHEGKKEKGWAVCGPLRGCCGATPCGAKQAVPSRSELLRAQTVLLRRLRRLAKLDLGDCGCGYCYGWGRTRRGLRAQTVLRRGQRRLRSAVVALCDYTIPPYLPPPPEPVFRRAGLKKPRQRRIGHSYQAVNCRFSINCPSTLARTCANCAKIGDFS